MLITRFAIIPHHDGHRILLVPRGEGWTLPSYQTEGPIPSLELFIQALREQLGVEVIVLRSAGAPHKTAQGDVTRFYWMEKRGSRRPGGGARWFDEREACAHLENAPLQRAAVEEWFREARSGEIPPHRSPWAAAGWHDEALAWISAAVERRELGPILAVEQFRSWAITHMLRVVTPTGALYFKASHPMFPHEARLTCYLAERHPAHLPGIIAADGERNWLLMEEFEGPALGDVTEPAAWEESMRLFASIQVESVERAEELLALGCPDRRLPRLAPQMTALFEDERAMTVVGESALSAAQIEAVRGLQPELESEIERLSAYDIPPALLHGDLHARNVVITEGGPLLYDWSDGALTHPFFELLTTFWDLRSAVAAESAPERARRAYLEPWTRYASLERLEQALDLSHKLLPLYHAVSYYWIYQNTEPHAQWELGGSIAEFLKELLLLFGLDTPEAAPGSPGQ